MYVLCWVHIVVCLRVCVWVCIAVCPRTVSGRAQRKFRENNGPRKPVKLTSEVKQTNCDLFRQQSEDGGTIEEQYLSSDIQLYKGVCVCVCVCVCVFACVCACMCVCLLKILKIGLYFG